MAARAYCMPPAAPRTPRSTRLQRGCRFCCRAARAQRKRARIALSHIVGSADVDTGRVDVVSGLALNGRRQTDMLIVLALRLLRAARDWI